MDGSQITGTASSYARKYALNGLFNIDDTKDADTDEYANQNKSNNKSDSNEFNEWQVTENNLVTDLEAKTVYGLVMDKGRDLKKFLEYFKIKNTKELTKTQYVEALKMLKGDN